MDDIDSASVVTIGDPSVRWSAASKTAGEDSATTARSGGASDFMREFTSVGSSWT